MGTRAFLGSFLHAPIRGRVEMLQDALVVVAADGTIRSTHHGGTVEAADLIRRHREAGSLETRPAGHYGSPG